MTDREPRIDLFDDPPWDTAGGGPRTPLAWLGDLALLLFVVALILLGLVGVLAVISFFAGADGSLLNFGSIDLGGGPPSSYGMDIVLSSDGSRAYVTEPTQNRLDVLDTISGRVLATVSVGNDPSGLALSPDGTQVWVVNTSLSTLNAGSVTVVSTATDQVLRTVPVGLGPIDVAFSPDGRRAYVTDNGVVTSGSVSVIDTATFTVVGTLTPPATAPETAQATPSEAPSGLPTSANLTSVAVTPDGQQVWVSEVDDLNEASNTPDFVDVFSSAAGAPVARIRVGAGPFFMVFSADGDDAYVADKVSCDVRQIDTATLAVVSTVHWPSWNGCPYGLATGPEGNLVYTVTGDDHTLQDGVAGDAFGSVDFTTGQTRVLGQVGEDPVTVAVSADGTTAYVVDADTPEIDVVDLSDGSIRSVIRLPTS